MRKTKEISSFFYSQYFAEGLRITIGTIIPVIVCALFGEFKTGTLISLGALVIGLSDTPGAPRHRKIGMLYCTALCILVIIITSLVNGSLILMTLTIATISFLSSMLAVFNARAATIGTMCVLTMLFNIDNFSTLEHEIIYLFYFIIGALWYLTVSFSIMQVRPYRLAQQELSEAIRHVAEYIRLKANFYKVNEDLDNNYIKLIEQQVIINNDQENIRDILFQSKRSIKDSTKEGRYLTLIFNDIVDLFEQSMTTHYDYEMIRNKYADTDILDKIRNILLKVTHELDNIGYKINANQAPKPIYDFDEEILQLRDTVDEYDSINNSNSIPLKKIIINIRAIIKHLKDIYTYAQFKDADTPKAEIEESKKFIKRDILNWQSFRDNLSLESTVFRHALRMAIVLSMTYFVFRLIPNISHQGLFWILLTILVIIKPGFGLTKERNLQRLLGTIIGGIIGGIILYLVPDPAARFVILVVFFLIAYSLFRVNYIMAVIFMTPYVLIMLSFTGTNTLEMTKLRILDTFIGGTIAFLSSYIIFPNWESLQIKSNIRNLLIANYQYLAQAVSLLANNTFDITEYKLARKEVYIASANMGSTFQRLLTEPKWRQKITKEVNRFVILNHIFSSYAATLITQLRITEINHFDNSHLTSLYKTLSILEKLITSLETEDFKCNFVKASGLVKFTLQAISTDDAKLITEQLQFLNKIATDIQKVTEEIELKSKVLERNKKLIDA